MDNLDKKCAFCEYGTEPTGSEMKQYLHSWACDEHDMIWFKKAIGIADQWYEDNKLMLMKMTE
mgnify:CR=1 FL=1